MNKREDLLESYRKENQLKEDKIKSLNNIIKRLKETLDKHEELLKYQSKLTTYWEMKYNKKSSWLFTYHEPPLPNSPK